MIITRTAPQIGTLLRENEASYLSNQHSGRFQAYRTMTAAYDDVHSEYLIDIIAIELSDRFETLDIDSDDLESAESDIYSEALSVLTAFAEISEPNITRQKNNLLAQNISNVLFQHISQNELKPVLRDITNINWS